MGFISLGDDLQFGDFESEGYSPSVGATPPATPMDQSQLETEMFPPESVPSEEQPMGKMRSAKLNLHHMRYRFPEWDADAEDTFCAFGEDLISPDTDAGVWEIEISTESFVC